MTVTNRAARKPGERISTDVLFSPNLTPEEKKEELRWIEENLDRVNTVKCRKCRYRWVSESNHDLKCPRCKESGPYIRIRVTFLPKSQKRIDNYISLVI